MPTKLCLREAETMVACNNLQLGEEVKAYLWLQMSQRSSLHISTQENPKPPEIGESGDTTYRNAIPAMK